MANSDVVLKLFVFLASSFCFENLLEIDRFCTALAIHRSWETENSTYIEIFFLSVSYFGSLLFPMTL